MPTRPLNSRHIDVSAILIPLQWKEGGIDMAIRIDKAGRLVVPLELRRALRLEDGGEVELSLSADGLCLRRVAPEASVTVEHGIPVVSLGGATVTNDSVLDVIDRDRGVR